MKKLFFLMAAIMVVTMSFAQSSTLATLSHNGQMSIFYGSDALKSAHDAAQHGDVITLSSGTFNGVTITKALTIRGAGMMANMETKTLPTVIANPLDGYSVDINIPSSVKEKLVLEGLYFSTSIDLRNNLTNASLLKCYVQGIFRNNNIFNNVSIIHCKIQNAELSGTGVIMNSFIETGFEVSNHGYVGGFECTNCVIAGISSPDGILKNCIIYNPNDNVNSVRLSYSSSAYYCIGIHNFFSNDDMFRDLANGLKNQNVKKLSEIFESYDGKYTDDETFELKSDAKTKYLGSDGTEVGIYGGNLPFNPTPSNPQITKCNVAPKSTADGKLSVEIEVRVSE